LKNDYNITKDFIEETIKKKILNSLHKSIYRSLDTV